MKEITKDQIKKGMKLMIRDKQYSYYLICEGYDGTNLKYDKSCSHLRRTGLYEYRRLFIGNFGLMVGDEIYVLTDEDWIKMEAQAVLHKLGDKNEKDN